MKFATVLTIFLGMNSISLSSQDAAGFIKRIGDYQRAIKLTRDEPTDIDTSTFNLKKYLSLFDKLRIQDGMKCECVYFDNRLDGKPYIIATKDSFNLEGFIGQKALMKIRKDTIFRSQIKISHPKSFEFLNHTDSARKIDRIIYDTRIFKEVYHFELYKFLSDSINRAYNYMIPEDSEEGYLQYAYFREFSEMFGLKWHAGYIRKSVIYSRAKMEQAIKEFSGGELFTIPDRDKLKNLRSIEPSPIIELTSTHCILTWIELEDFNGIYKRTYQISRKNPHEIREIAEDQLIEIQPNFVF